MTKYLTAFLILWAIPTSSQEYLPLAIDGSRWFYEQYQPFADFPATLGGYMISVEGDTLLQSRRYKKVYIHGMAGDHACQFPPCWTFEKPYRSLNRRLVSLIYEDIAARKIYNLPLDSTILEFCGNEEYLMFDFSLEQGDTLNDCALEIINLAENEVVDYDLDTVYLSTETFATDIDDFFDPPRRTHSIGGYDYFVGLLFETEVAIAEGFGYARLGIFGQKGALLVDYCRGSLQECEIISNSEEYSQDRLLILPNPVIDMMVVEGRDRLEQIKILDTSGNLLKEVQNSNQVDLSELPTGIYFAVITEGERQYIRRLMKM